MQGQNTKSFTVIASLALIAGCAGSFDGELDGEKPQFQQALYGTHKFEEGGHATVVLGLSFAMECDKLGKLMTRQSEIAKELAETERTDEDIKSAAKKLDDVYASAGWPDTGWQASVLVLSEDKLGTGDKFDVFGENDALVGVSLSHQTAALDHEEILKEGEDGNVDRYVAVDGKIKFVNVVEKSSMKLESTSELDLVESGDLDEDGDDADIAGQGVLSLDAKLCPALADAIADSFTVSVDVDIDQCEAANECPTIGCVCDNGSPLGQTVNSQSCLDGICADEFDACPDSCDQLGLDWTGDTVDPVDPGPGPGPDPEPSDGQEGSCGSFLGANDGCDCGCGTVDSDCAGGQTDSCAFNNCVTGSPDPANNSQCIL